MPQKIDIRNYVNTFMPGIIFTTYKPGEIVAAIPEKPDKTLKAEQYEPASYSTGKLDGKPDKRKAHKKPTRNAISAQHTMRAKSRDNAGFKRGKQSAIATLDNGEQIILMVPMKRRRGSKYSGGLS